MRSSSFVILSAILIGAGALTALSHASEGPARCVEPPTNTKTAVPTVAPWVARGLLVTNPNDDRRALRLPAALAGREFQAALSLRVCVSESGAVSGVQIVDGAGEAVDAAVVETVSRWRYLPYSVEGRPSPFCYRLRYELTT